MTIMALDISTTHVGYSIIESDTLLEHEIGCVDLHLVKDYDKKLDEAIAVFATLIEKFNVSTVVVEEFAKMFTPGKSSADVIIKLAVFNGTLTYVLRRLRKVAIERVNVRHARAVLGIKIPSGTYGDAKKTLILNHMKQLSKAPALYLTKRSGAPADTCFDAADSLVIARAWATEVNGPVVKKKTPKAKK